MTNYFLQNKRNMLFAACSIAIICIAMPLYRAHNKPKVVKTVPVVRSMTIGTTDASTSVIYPGTVHGRHESALAFQVGGKINGRYVNLGDRVKAGQVLMSLDPKDVQQSVEAAQAALLAATSNQQLAETNALRYRQLYANGATSKAVLDNYNAQLDAANATLREAQAQANIGTHQLEYTQLISDADGVIASLVGEVGMVTAAGVSMATIVRDGDREVQISVPENALTKLRPGLPATISFWALENTTCSGHIREISSAADALTKTYRVNVVIDNMPKTAKLGMTAKVCFQNLTNNTPGFLVPSSAIYKASDKTHVWLIKDNKVQLQEVTISGYRDNDVIISQGLKTGDHLVTAGVNKLVEQQEVRLLTDNVTK